MYKLVSTTALAVALATPSFAQNWSGNLGFTHAMPEEDGATDVTTYFGGVEYAFNRNFSLALDLAIYNIEDLDAGIASSTWHLIYHLDEQTSVGFFAGGEAVEDDTEFGSVSETAVTYGLEGGTEYGDAAGEAYIGLVDAEDADENMTILGASGEYTFSGPWAAIGSFDYQSLDDYSLSNVAVGVNYAFTEGGDVFAKFGQLSAEIDGLGDDDTTYFEVGATVAFGANRGTTFNRRSVFEAF